MLEQLGYRLKTVGYRDWLKAFAQNQDLLANPLLPMLSVLQEPVREPRTRWELYEDMAQYDITNTKEALSDGPKTRSGVVFEDIRRYVAD